MNQLPYHVGGKNVEKLLTIAACLCIAAIFWVFNALNHDYDATLRIPIHIKIQENDLVLAKSMPYLEVAANGYGWYLFLYSLGFDISPILVNKAKLNYKSRIENYSLLSEIKAKLSQVNIKYIVNDTCYLEFDIVKQKKVYLKLDTATLPLQSGKNIVGAITVSPNFIVCTGPEKELSLLPDSISFAISHQYIENNFDEFVPIHYKPSPGVSHATNRVKVSFAIQ